MAGTTVTFSGLDTAADIGVKSRGITIKIGTLLTLTGGGLPAFTTGDPTSVYAIEQQTDDSGNPIGAPVWGDTIWENLQALGSDLTEFGNEAQIAYDHLVNGAAPLQFFGVWNNSRGWQPGEAAQGSDGHTYTPLFGTVNDPVVVPGDWADLASDIPPRVFVPISSLIPYDPNANSLAAPGGSLALSGSNVWFNVTGTTWITFTANITSVGSSHSSDFTAPANQISTATATCAVTLPASASNGSILAVFCTAGVPTVTGTGVSDTLGAGDHAYYIWSGAAWVRTSDLASVILAAAATDATTKVATETSRATTAEALLTPKARQIITGTGLLGGGDLTADRTLTPDFGSGAGKVTQGNDARLSDTRTPTDGSVTAAKITNNAVTVEKSGARPFFFILGQTDQLIPSGQITPVAFIRTSQVDVDSQHPANTATTTIAAGSNNVALPTGTINVASTTGFDVPAGGIYTVCVAVTIGGVLVVFSYSGVTSTTFTGCTLGVGTLLTGQTVVPARERFLINTAGNYQVTPEMHWAPSPVGGRMVQITGVGGLIFVVYRSMTGATNTVSPLQAIQVTGQPTATPGQAAIPYRIEVWQDSGVPLLLKQDQIMAPAVSSGYLQPNTDW